MAPSSKGTNPAPNYTVAMNQVQTQLEAQLRVVRSFMPSRPPGQTPSHPASAKPTSSFSALLSTSTSHSPLSSTSKPSQTRQQIQKQDQESLFAETRAQDPNAGLGFGGPKRTSEREKERENQILRSRLLGRKRGAADASGRPLRRAGGEESSDEEPGRSGLGRAKKRARREESRDDTPRPIIESEVIGKELEEHGATQLKDDGLENSKWKAEDGDIDTKDDQDTVPLPDDLIPNSSAEASDQKKRKKKRKKKKKDKLNETGVE
ncbi:hypothetical protein GGS24DRAFT_321127 [Hypoxylon argillaceum]|nr:hypothetical protein GGS24DRAFT_321127 [Hypoxylon argillaceum]